MYIDFKVSNSPREVWRVDIVTKLKLCNLYEVDVASSCGLCSLYHHLGPECVPIGPWVGVQLVLSVVQVQGWAEH